MADLYPQTYSNRQPSYHRQDQQQYPVQSTQGIVYPQLLNTSQPAPVSDDHQSPPRRSSPRPPRWHPASSPSTRPHHCALSLLERPENHHMIRWDPAGEHIIVERPEQLALHVLPSVYRQSRFASFSRQLNIYGFMRKVNLRNVDPAIDDPDASTWSHPTLNRHSPAEVVANFKRRVPPRLPKPRKRDNEVPAIPPSRPPLDTGGRPRGFSSPGSFTPIGQAGAPSWSSGYARGTLPPLTVPSDPPMSSHAMYSHSSHITHPITPTDDTPSSASFSPMTYQSAPRDAMMLPSPSSQYPYTEQTSNSWGFSPTSTSSHSSGSLSSLLNPSTNMNGGYSNASRPTPPAINTHSSYGSVPMSRGHYSAGGLSPDSRPTSGYSVSSMSSMPDAYAEPNSSHHPSSARPLTPSSSRPPSSKSYNTSSLSIRRARRHSQAMHPYPSPYGEHPPLSAGSERPSSSPQPDEHPGNITRVRSMIQLNSTDTYGFNPAQADFAYGAVDDGHVSHHGHGMYVNTGRSVRPSTSASSLSTSSSAANTPGGDGFGPGAGEADINRFSPDFGFVQMNEHLPHYAKGEM
ncbi:HSF-type DNA-binding-domain-containing protein [Fomitopsis serialis]|uniref:HSF-type DNA-binding-domain-containing protein n=1 Tax=Fomitopsis serialis TaxID=139415 RepID=UPI002008D724|nr:HSF-type DNA-binding-domain-containing protein [Neoantrodia serialis]KAH9938408.1 HSF-type DNA-binding-domain-containing protein [Neoantrodia serialis]